jgi:hypothetical protein
VTARHAEARIPHRNRSATITSEVFAGEIVTGNVYGFNGQMPRGRVVLKIAGFEPSLAVYLP